MSSVCLLIFTMPTCFCLLCKIMKSNLVWSHYSTTVIVMRFAIQLLQSYWIMNNTSLPPTAPIVEFTAPLDPDCYAESVNEHISSGSGRSLTSLSSLHACSTWNLSASVASLWEKRREERGNSVFICFIFLHKYFSLRLHYCQLHDNSFCPNCDGLKPYFPNLGVMTVASQGCLFVFGWLLFGFLTPINSDIPLK